MELGVLLGAFTQVPLETLGSFWVPLEDGLCGFLLYTSDTPDDTHFVALCGARCSQNKRGGGCVCERCGEVGSVLRGIRRCCV